MTSNLTLVSGLTFQWLVIFEKEELKTYSSSFFNLHGFSYSIFSKFPPFIHYFYKHFCSHRSFLFLFLFLFFINILFALLHLKSYQFARKDMYVAFQCSSLFLLPSSTPSASRRILQKVRLPPLVSSRPSSFRYSSRILPSLFSCRHMSKFLRRSCFRIEGF